MAGDLIPFFFLVGPLPTRCRYSGLLLHLITLSDKHACTLGRTPLDEGSAGRRGLYLHKTLQSHERDGRAPVVFEPAIPSSKRLQTLL